MFRIIFILFVFLIFFVLFYRFTKNIYLYLSCDESQEDLVNQKKKIEIERKNFNEKLNQEEKQLKNKQKEIERLKGK